MFSSTKQQLLFSFIESRLPSSLAEAQALLATGTETSLSLLSQQLQKRGLHPTQPDTTLPILFAEKTGASAKTLLLYYHYDEDADKATNLLPFLASLATFDLYRQHYGTLPISVKWLLDASGNKKTFSSSPGIQLLSQQLQADYILWHTLLPKGEQVPSLALGVKGYLSVSLILTTASFPIASSYGAVLPNAAWRLLWALNSLKDAREDILIDGFYDTLVSADNQAIEQLYTLPDTLTLHTQQPAFLFHLRKFPLHYAHLLTPTCSLLSFDSQSSSPSSSSENAHFSLASLPTEAHAQVDFYLVPNQTPDDIFPKLQRHFQESGFADLSLQLLSATYSTSIPSTHPFVTCLQQAISNAYGTTASLLPLSAENFPFALTTQSPPLLVLATENAPVLEEGTQIDAEAYTKSMKYLTLLLENLSDLSPDPQILP